MEWDHGSCAAVTSHTCDGGRHLNNNQLTELPTSFNKMSLQDLYVIFAVRAAQWYSNPPQATFQQPIDFLPARHGDEIR